ncbi:MAG: DUF2530 domain-containing protein [Cellulomonadaceae bacterium]|jgi:hypothetical protein|nr:DUF2530 domain-containing protein [Cellulomonadaceae bacterium]
MPSVFDVLTKPETRRPSPGPLLLPMAKIMGIGTVLWVVAAIVAGIVSHSNAVWVCIAGAVLGVLGTAFFGRRNHGMR